MMKFNCGRINYYLQKSNQSILLRDFAEEDRKDVYKLLYFLPDLYPKGNLWLHSRLDDVLSKKAKCVLVDSLFGILGISIETPKGNKNVKLSTFYIHPLGCVDINNINCS